MPQDRKFQLICPDPALMVSLMKEVKVIGREKEIPGQWVLLKNFQPLMALDRSFSGNKQC
jgi:hypothetical protein